jgi:hypothetical protein
LFAVAVVCLAVTSVFYRMWAGERSRNEALAKSVIDQAGPMAKTLADLTNSNNRQADALDALADEVQRTREETLRYRLEHKGAV